MSDIKNLQNRIIEFRDERDWKQFHNPKDLAISLILEASELLEHFQWKNIAEIEDYVKIHKSEIADELADVLNNVLLLAHDLDIEIIDHANKKMTKNAKKYPVDKAKGRSEKYTKLAKNSKK